MDIPEPRPRPFRISDPRQARIHERLQRLVDPCAAAFYHDAVELMETRPSYQALSHVVGHLLRDIESALREKLSPLSPPNAQGKKAVDDTRENHKDSVRCVCSALGLTGSQVEARWLDLCGREDPRALNTRAHRTSAGPPRPVDESFLDFWEDIQEILGVVLREQEARFLRYLPKLDVLLGLETPTERKVTSLRKMPQSLVLLRYFFTKLQWPAWLRPLQEKHFFDDPPPARYDPEREVVEHTVWPQSGYLARMSALDPETVRDVILAMPDTDNICVMDDLVEAAKEMPPAVATDLVTRIASWLEKPYGPYRTDHIGELAARLAEGGEAESALQLAEAVLHLEASDDGGSARRLRTRGRPDTWGYEQLLTQSVPRIVASVGQPAFDLLCGLLDQAVSISTPAESGRWRDSHSYMWHHAVESDPDGRFGDVSNLLVSAVRDAALRVISDRKMSVRAVVTALRRRRCDIFDRISLHVLRVCPTSPRALIADRLVRKRRFAKMSELDHEYVLLFRDAFGSLRDEEQRTVLAWMEKGPDLKRYARRYRRSSSGSAPTDEEVDSYAKLWRYDRLALIADHLPKEWLERYERLKNELGEPRPLDAPRPRHFGVWVGRKSPKTAGEINSMPVRELVDFLNAWSPEGHPDRPSYDGLSEALAGAVAADPGRYARAAGVLRELDKPGFVSAVLDGFRGALEQKRRLRWRPVLDLCFWVVGQPVRQPAAAAPDEKSGGDWHQARYAVVTLMDRALRPGAGLDIRLRERVWGVIEPVTSDMEPHEAEAEAENASGRNWDALPSTIRSTALECAVRYAIWVYDRARKRAPDQSFDFSAVPEVRAVLDHHVDPRNDTSRAVRQVFGLFFPQLVMLDAEWARQNARRVFPHGDDCARLRSPAWNAYLKFCRPYTSVFAVLADEYRYAVETLPSRAAHEGGLGPSDDNLAEHVMVYYWWGKVDLTEPGNLIESFFSTASDELRAHAMEFVGRSLRAGSARVPGEVIRRLRSLWDWRLSVARNSADQCRKEIGSFGWWYHSRKFPRRWALRQLASAIHLARWIEPSTGVLDSLVEDFAAAPEVVLDCVGGVADSAPEVGHWGFVSLVEPMHAILERALQPERLRARALRVVNKLGEAGYIEQFRDLADRYET